ncbi:cation efflux family-domain-containing protein [Amylocarpus encephaloides]|uniref:Cation efflux family-domain-containing protein n=1 Tax=Amylocarpus encephaloides TaxID=45428 RepID=A0A9P7YDK6_9HELO|nr:cation efflux family-domain-containing protein [Amylocarpus encephaloides]
MEPGSESSASSARQDKQAGPLVASSPSTNSDANSSSQALAASKNDDPYALRGYKREDANDIKQQRPQNLTRRKHKKIKKYYNRQNALIDAYLGSNDEEQLEIEDTAQNGGKVRFAVNASFVINFCLFVIQLYAAISTGSLSLFATAADAFMDLVSSIVMLVTSRLAAKPNLEKFPVGRKRVETVGILLFCALMTTVSVQLIIESARSLSHGPSGAEELHIIPIAFVSIAIFSKASLFIYCFLLRRYPAANIFMIDHRNDIAVNLFGLIMSIVGTRYVKVWFLDPTGAIAIACLILYSWASTAFEHMWYLVGKSAPQDFLNKLVYVTVTHDPRIQKIETARAYHAGDKYYVEVDVIMSETETLKVTHDVSQALQRKLEGLAHVERAFVHVDYEDDHDVSTEHKALYDVKAEEENVPLSQRIKKRFTPKGNEGGGNMSPA